MIASPRGRCSTCGDTTYKDCGGLDIPHTCAPTKNCKSCGCALTSMPADLYYCGGCLAKGLDLPPRFARRDVEAILSEVECEPYDLRVVQVGDARMAIQARLYREDVETLAMSWGSGGKFYVSPWSTREEIVQKALGACLAYANHEVRERFLWRGRRIFGPHISHDRLWDIAEDTVQRRKGP